MPFALAALILLESCASSTVIQSNPTGAKLYLNSNYVGTTPYRHTDTKIVGTTTYVRLEKEGYEPLTTSFSRDEQADAGAIIGGIFLLFPFLWTMKYDPSHTYELASPGTPQQPTVAPMPLANDPASVSASPKAARLRDAKKLLDEGILTKENTKRKKRRFLIPTISARRPVRLPAVSTFVSHKIERCFVAFVGGMRHPAHLRPITFIEGREIGIAIVGFVNFGQVQGSGNG